MRVLAMTSLFPNPYQPNMWSPNRLQLSWLAKRVPVDVIAPLPWTTERAGKKRDGDLLKQSRSRQVDNLRVEHPRYWFPPGTLRGSYGRFYRWSVRKAFHRHVALFKPDVVFTHWAYPDGWAAVKLGHEAGLPVVIQVLGSDVLLLNKMPGRRRGTVQALGEADGVWAVSQDLSDHLAKLGVNPNHIRVIYDGVDTSLFHSGNQAQARTRLKLTSTKKLILFVGNLVAVKGIDKLLATCQCLHEQGVACETAILGQGELRVSHEATLRELSCRDSVTFYGSVPQETLPDWYRAADVLVLPSLSEGVPNVLLEASACGLPYVASNVGGIPEIATRGHGTLVPVGDVAALTQAIRQVLNQPKPDVVAPRSRADCIDDFLVFLQEVQARFRDKGIAS